MSGSGIVKYHVKLKFEVEGIVEKADLIGAIFGQTEGLFGPEMNLHELQKTWKVGRIEITLNSKNDSTTGEVVIPMSTDVNTAALIAAAVESIDKVGPCQGRFQLSGIEDVRATRRKAIVERAKYIMKDWAAKTSSQGEEMLKDVQESVRRSKVINFGKEELPAGAGVYTSDTVYLVEGRADVINLLRAGIENVIAIEGTKIPESIIRLSKEKRVIAFLDGDRGGDLILKELGQVARIESVVRAPPGKEVEDLTPVEILQILRKEPAAVTAPPPRARTEAEVELPDGLANKTREIFPTLNGSLEAVIFDANLQQLDKFPVSQLVNKLESVKGAKYVVFDGIVTQRLLDESTKSGVLGLIGHRTGELPGRPADVQIVTFRELGLE